MCQDHPPAAVPLESQLGQCGSFLHASEQKRQVGVPLVTDDLATGEATDGDDHLEAGEMAFEIEDVMRRV